MSYKFSLSTIATLIEWLEKYNSIGHHQAPLLFIKKHFCDQKLFVNKKLEVKIFEKICKCRKFIEFMLESKNLELSVSIIVHLYLMAFFMSESSKSIIFESMEKNFTREIVNDLMELIYSGEIVMADEDRESECKFIVGDCLQIETSEPCQAPPPTARPPSTRPSSTRAPSTACTSTRSGYTIKRTRDSTNSIESENKLDKILEKLPTKLNKELKVTNFKKNTASVLRTGALVSNKIKSNDFMINEIAAGSSDPMAISDYFNKIIEKSHLEEIQEIARKHLLGLISLEEARLAKIEAVRRNQTVVENMKKEREKLLKIIDSEKERQAFTSKFIIRKTHLGRLKAKKNLFAVALEKKMTAGKMRQLSEHLQKESEAAKSEELSSKIKLIQKIKSLEEKSKIDRLNRPKLDEYQKMSTIELKESIKKLNHQLEDEKQFRQQKIIEERERQKKLLSNTETLIQTHKLRRASKPDKIERDVEPTSEVMKLRQKLVQMRQLTSKS